MKEATLVILVHQILYQGMFFAKNVLLRRKLGKPIRGYNPEASLSIAFFVVFIGLSIWLAQSDASPGSYPLLNTGAAQLLGLALLGANLLIGLASLRCYRTRYCWY